LLYDHLDERLIFKLVAYSLNCTARRAVIPVEEGSGLNVVKADNIFHNPHSTHPRHQEFLALVVSREVISGFSDYAGGGFNYKITDHVLVNRIKKHSLCSFLHFGFATQFASRFASVHCVKGWVSVHYLTHTRITFWCIALQKLAIHILSVHLMFLEKSGGSLERRETDPRLVVQQAVLH
jgi:hypothetical protein